MKRFALLLTLTLASLSFLATTAEAKRFGGGSSVGKQRTMSAPVQKAPAAAPAAAPATTTPAAAPAPAPQTGNKWLGPLAGLAIGAGLGALFMGGGLGGMGGAIGSVLMIVALVMGVMLLISFFRRKQQPAMQYAGHGGLSTQPEPQHYAGSAAPAPVSAANIPADFPLDAFLRSAKMSFIRLQAANDRKDLNDVREYTTPEMYAEVSMQFSERGNAPQTTEVVSVNAELLEVATENELAIASVRMTGQLRENNGPAESFDEIWHVQKNLKDSKSVWLLAGIQQIN